MSSFDSSAQFKKESCVLIMFSFGNGVPCVYEKEICDEMLRKDDVLLLLLQSLYECVEMNDVIVSLRVFITMFVDLM